MPRLQRLSGAELLRIFRGFGFAVHSQRGSHIKLRRARADGTTETLTIPAHREIKLGTLHEIFTQAARFIPEADLRPQTETRFASIKKAWATALRKQGSPTSGCMTFATPLRATSRWVSGISSRRRCSWATRIPA